jgi:hypothetical protein
MINDSLKIIFISLQKSGCYSVLEPVTPKGGGIRAVMTVGAVCEAVTSWIVFFSGSVAKGFLQTSVSSSEYRSNSQATKY